MQTQAFTAPSHMNMYPYWLHCGLVSGDTLCWQHCRYRLVVVPVPSLESTLHETGQPFLPCRLLIVCGDIFCMMLHMLMLQGATADFDGVTLVVVRAAAVRLLN